MTKQSNYPVQLHVEYPYKLSRWKTFFRPLLIIPIFLLLSVLVGNFEFWFSQSHVDPNYHNTGGGFGPIFGTPFAGFFLATATMIVLRQKYPRWWFDFVLGLMRFIGRISAYCFLLTDDYPSTDEEQGYHLEMVYPDVENELNRWLPLVKWLLAIPHYVVFLFLGIGLLFSVVIAWIAILLSGRYPGFLFDFVVGTLRWWTRVFAYAVLLVTDRYPPFSLK